MSQEEKLPKILIVEDDERLARLTQEYLIRNGLEVGVEPDGNRAIRRIIAEQPDLVVLDVMLPGADGLTICREVRPHYHQPILMLTARTEDMDQVLGLEMGADDYVAKPVQPRVLLARIRALLRRTDKVPEDEVAQRIEFDDLVIDNGGRSVTLNGELVDFTSAEYDLLWLLASNAGRILSREDIFERLRGIEYDGQDRSIDVRISRIRLSFRTSNLRIRTVDARRQQAYQPQRFVQELVGVLAVPRSPFAALSHQPDPQTTRDVVVDQAVDTPHRALAEIASPTPQKRV